MKNIIKPFGKAAVVVLNGKIQIIYLLCCIGFHFQLSWFGGVMFVCFECWPAIEWNVYGNVNVNICFAFQKPPNRFSMFNLYLIISKEWWSVL